MATLRLCSFPGCGKPACNVRGWCWSHYTKWRRHGDPAGIGTAHGDPGRWLNLHANYKGDECLTWPFATSEGGYGRVWFDKRPMPANRAMCIIVHGYPISPSDEAAHSCGNGHLGCVNPNHLRWATSAQNAADRIAQGTVPRGERHSHAKVTAAQVEQIRALRGKLSQREIARLFGIGQSRVSAIQRRAGWTHIG